jgi:hypothetical protein
MKLLLDISLKERVYSKHHLLNRMTPPPTTRREIEGC